jgi:multicomponent Na+:H+ antiporter subunit B
LSGIFFKEGCWTSQHDRERYFKVKLLAFIVVIITGALLIYTTVDMPNWGDPNSPPNAHVSPRYIEKTIEETATPNVVTAVLADYRGYDTLGELVVIFTAGIVCIFLLRRTSDDK